MSAAMRWGDLLVRGDARRDQLRARRRDGIDGVEVERDGLRLAVLFLEHAPAGVTQHNVRIDGEAGAVPVRPLTVRRVAGGESELEDRLLVSIDRRGSAGRYVLRLVEREPDGRPGRAPLRGLDPRYAEAAFRFDVDAPVPTLALGPAGAAASESDISYLGRDYEGLRQLMLDRLGVTLPAWTERHAADLLVTLVELLAYVGDDLSYYQDAVATEAYLRTARRRISVRRHARLVDYRLHEGCQARGWVCVRVSAALELPLGDVRFAAAGSLGTLPTPILGAHAAHGLTQYTPLSGSPNATAALRPAHNEIPLWTWGERTAELVAGATTALLVDGLPGGRRPLRLVPGEVLILEQIHDPAATGAPGDPSHRQAVRLLEVEQTEDGLYEQPLLAVRWAAEDALAFALPAVSDGVACAVARGNVVLVGHGVRVAEDVSLDAPALARPGLSFAAPFPDPKLVGRHQARALRSLPARWIERSARWRRAAIEGVPLTPGALADLVASIGEDAVRGLGLDADIADDEERAAVQALALAELLAQADRLLRRRLRRLEVLARLADGSGALPAPLVDELVDDWGAALAGALDPGRPGAWGPARAALAPDGDLLPVLELTAGAQAWAPAPDLIGLAAGQRAVMAEVDDAGVAHLRLATPPGEGTLRAAYSVGLGTAGNAGPEAIDAVLWTGAGPPGSLAAIAAVRNPLPAIGGLDPESIDAARLAIGGAYLEDQPRALAPADYVARAEAVPDVRAAGARMRFTGALAVVEVAVQPERDGDPRPSLLELVARSLGIARRAGHAVEVRAPEYRPLAVELKVVLAARTSRAEATTALARLLGSGWMPDGRPAFFSPANVSFGQPVYASALLATVHALAGVQAAALTRLDFLDEPASPIVPAVLTVGELEIVRLDNDPLAPQRGFATVTFWGGR
jgi:predicted phage baseplate assembly protein